MNSQILLTLALLALAGILSLKSLQRFGLWLIALIGRIATLGMIAVGLAAIWIPSAPVVNRADAVTAAAGIGIGWSLPIRMIAVSSAAVVVLLPFMAAFARSASINRRGSSKRVSCIPTENRTASEARRRRGESNSTPIVGVDSATSLMRRIAQGK